jgi:hypothetical protein
MAVKPIEGDSDPSILQSPSYQKSGKSDGVIPLSARAVAPVLTLSVDAELTECETRKPVSRAPVIESGLFARLAFNHECRMQTVTSSL